MADEGNAQAQANSQQSGETPATTQPATPAPAFDEWLKGQPADVQKLLDGHFAERTTGLKSALDSERNSRAELDKQLKKALSELKEGSEARDQLEQARNALALANLRADFVNAAYAAGAAKADRLFRLAHTEGKLEKAEINDEFIATLKAEYPEYFPAPAPKEKPATEADKRGPATEPSQDWQRVAAQKFGIRLPQ